MPRPFASAGSEERRLTEALSLDPLAPELPLVASDEAEERGERDVPSVLRGVEELRARGLPVARPQLLSLLRGVFPAETEFAAVAESVRRLLSAPLGQVKTHEADALEADLAAALGPPQRGDGMLALLGAGGRVDAGRLREQYEFQVTLLASLDLLERRGGALGISGIDGRFHALPPLARVHERLRSPEFLSEVAKGFNELLLVPFALPLPRLFATLRRGLLRNQRLLPPPRGPGDTPLAVQEPYGRQELAYFPRRYEEDHGGRTKAQVLADTPSAGWQVLLVRAAAEALPYTGMWHVPPGLRQVLAGHHDARLDGIGWTPETYVMAFLTALERSGYPLGAAGHLTYLTAAYLPSSDELPYATWGVDAESLGAHHLDSFPWPDDPRGCVGAAVRVL